VCGRRQQSTDKFCTDTLSRHGIRARPYTDPQAAVRGARLIITSTSHSGSPFLKPDWLTRGTLVVMIDRLRVVTRALLAQAGRIVTNSPDSLASWGREEDGKMRATLPQIIAAGAHPRVSGDEIVLYDAGGIAIADLALSALLWQQLQSKACRV